jgi:GMP synthase (glutamine-hydrolysing)
VRPLAILQHGADCPPALVAAALDGLGVPYEVRRLDKGDPLPVCPDEASALIIMGGSMHVHQGDRYPFLEAEKRFLRPLLKRGFPIWGICLGAQLLADTSGAEVYVRPVPEIGWVPVEKVDDDPLLHGVASPFVAFEWHYRSFQLPPLGQLVADRSGELQAFRVGGRAWGTQFHPEVDADLIDRWISEARTELESRYPDVLESLVVETPQRLAASEALCRRLTANFLLTSGLLPAEK